MIALEITMPIASEWPSREGLFARNAVESDLIVAAVGKCTGAGSGMGKMHLSHRVNNESEAPAARAAIDEAMKKHMPGVQYEVTAYSE